MHHRDQLAFNNAHLHEWVFAMKLVYHLRHDGAGHAATHANIHLTAAQPQSLLDILFGDPQLCQYQAGMTKKLSPISVSTTPC